MSIKVKKTALVITYAIGWFFVNLLTLISYPVMHSDESWLAGLSQTMMYSKNLMATEPFFDLAPRAPHTLKTLFHLLQMPLIAVFGYDLFSVRFLSLIFGTLTLVLLYLYLDKVLGDPLLCLLGLALITLNSQYIYASHFARQEILLVFVMVLCLDLFTKNDPVSLKDTLVISCLIGCAISLHPNAFIIAMIIGMLYLLALMTHKIPFRTMVAYLVPMGLFAISNILVTLLSTPDFLNKYWQYASTLSVGADPTSRVLNFREFYIKLYKQITGTYYLTNLSYLVILLLMVVIMIVLSLCYTKYTGYRLTRIRHDYKKRLPLWQSLAMVVGFNLAIFLIGRNNPTSIVFLLVLALLFLVHLSQLIVGRGLQVLVLSMMLLLTLKATYDDYSDHQYHDYTDYEAFLESNIRSNDYVLGNLSGGFAMSPQQFYDFRNLNYLETTSLEDYIQSRQINTLIYYEEYAYIHRNPEWQILYGDDTGYYEQLQSLINNYGSLRAETSSPYYGNRIIRYMGDYPWSIKIYDIDVQAID